MIRTAHRYLLLGLIPMFQTCQQADQFAAKNTFNTNELSVFQLYSGKICELLQSDGKVRRVNCENLALFTDPNAEACAKVGNNVTAKFPDQSLAATLCRRESQSTDRPTQTTIRFAMYGDVGVGQNPDKGHFQRTVAENMRSVCPPHSQVVRNGQPSCDFALVAGDLIYPDGIRDVWDQQLKTKFERIYDGFGRYDIYAVPGNHDYHGNIQAAIDYTHFSERWRMLSQNFQVPHLPDWIRIYGLDSSPLVEGNSIENGTWQEIQATLCKPSGVNIVFAHHPLFSHGKHGPEWEMAPILQRIQDSCPIDFYLAGHDHHQEHVHSEGVDFVVQGAGGAETHGVQLHPGQERTLQLTTGERSYEQRYAKQSNGFSVFEANKTESGVAVTVSFYAVDTGKLDHTLRFDDYVYRCKWQEWQSADGCVPVSADADVWLTAD